MSEDYIPRRIALAKLAKETKRELERISKKVRQLILDWHHNEDDPEYYKYSAFFANASTVEEAATDAVECFYPDGDKQ